MSPSLLLLLGALAAPPNLDPALQSVVERAETETLAHFEKIELQPEQLSIVLLRLDPEAGTYQAGAVRGDALMYPASVVKMFYLAAAAVWLDQDRLDLTPELEDSVRRMIVVSSNTATSEVFNALTETESGPELPPDELKIWMDRRQEVNRWLAGLGYDILGETGINLCQTTYDEGPEGREVQGYGENLALRNRLSAAATARMLAEILLGRLASPERTEWMKTYLSRPVSGPREDTGKPDNQISGFLGQAMPEGTPYWSKAGWTSEVRHDVAAFELRGETYVLAVFTKDHPWESDLLPFVGRAVVEGLP